jgi:hypothetical protein
VPRQPPFTVTSDGHRYRVFVNDPMRMRETPDGYRYGHHQVGTRRIDNQHVAFERWSMLDEGGGFGPWEPAPRFEARAARPRCSVLPAMTEAVKDRWADEAFRHLHRLTGGEGCCVTTSRVAAVLPGWDDTQTFDAREDPCDMWSPLLWTWDAWVDMGTPSARKRAVALAGMALRRLAAQGRVESCGGTWWRLSSQSAQT